MPAPPTQPDPTEQEVLHAIAALFSKKRSAAALAHYPTLRVQTTNLHASLAQSILRVERVLEKWSNHLEEDSNVSMEFRAKDSPHYAYRTIAPALVKNLHRTSDFLLEETRATSAVDVDRVFETVPSFSGHVRLGGSVRGFIDALVQTAYQLINFDGLQLNYKFLQSLLSFVAIAPDSLHTNIASPEIQTAVNAFAALSKTKRKGSAFTKATPDPFVERLKNVCEFVSIPDWRYQNLDLLFSFCSDFVHSGYVSVLALKGDTPEVVMGGPGDAFTPRAENFAELKHRLLAECAGAYADLLLPSLRHAISRTLAAGIPADWAADLDASINEIGGVRSLLQCKLVEPVRKGLLGSDKPIQIECNCGGHIDLQPPHNEWDRFCEKCGSLFLLHEVDEEVDYVISASGPGDVLGGDAIKIPKLDNGTRSKLKRVWQKHAPKSDSSSFEFILIRDLARCDEETLETPSMISSAPKDEARSKCSIYAFVASKSLERCARIRIRCNCGSQVEYETSEATNICICPQCHSQIGLLGVAGDLSSVATKNPDGSKGTAPVQASRRFVEPGIGIN